MTQRELILLQIASNIYHEQINDLNTDSVKVEECSHPSTYWYYGNVERTERHCARCGAKNI